MQILITTDAVGGVWQYSLDLARGLSARGCCPAIALLGPSPHPHQRAEMDTVPGLRFIETGLPLDWLSNSSEPIRQAGAAIARLAMELGVDVVHLNMPTLAGAGGFGMPVVAVAHGCVSTWWEAAKDEPLDSQYEWHRQMMHEGLVAADRLVAPTASYAATIKRLYNLARTPDVVHNGRTSLPGSSPGAAPADRALTVGRLWDRVKRADLLDKVASKLEVPFAAAGALIGPHGETAVLEHLVTLGQLSAAQLGSELSAQPVFVSAASFEPFGLAVLEAANARCALVLSDIPGFRELWDGAALFVSGDDDAGYRQAIQSLLADPGARARLSDAAALRAARYTPQASADAMLSIYSALLGRRTSSGRVAA